jgi:hypothetical protein
MPEQVCASGANQWRDRALAAANGRAGSGEWLGDHPGGPHEMLERSIDDVRRKAHRTVKFGARRGAAFQGTQDGTERACSRLRL